MAFIPKTNVVNGNTIQASDITNIIDSLNGTGLYDISATGSLLGSASFATTASFAMNAGAAQGSNNQIQFNSGSILSGSANLIYNYISSSLAHGQSPTATGQYSHAEGDSPQAIGVASHAEGGGTTAIGLSSHAEGNDTRTGTQNAYYATSVSSGVVTLTSSYSDVSFEFVTDNLLYLYDAPFDGIYQRAYFKISQSYYVAPNTIVELYDTLVTTTTAYVGDINNAVLYWTGNQTIPGDYSHTEGEATIAIGIYSHAEGGSTQAIGANSHAEGVSAQAIGIGSHAEGESTQAIGDKSHTEGNGTIAVGTYSHAEGYNTQASGSFSHAEGYTTQAIGDYSHAEGEIAISYGIYSHAEGSATLASGSFSHAEGDSTIAYGTSSHAEGLSSQATGDYSHAEGGGTQAIGNYSHAEGYDTITLGLGSHAEGQNTIASGSYQHVSGKYNTHGDDTSLFIVGNGVSQDGRKDAFKVTHSSSILIPQTQSVAPSWTGRDGEIIPATVSGTHYLYMWMNGAWRSSSFA